VLNAASAFDPCRFDLSSLRVTIGREAEVAMSERHETARPVVLLVEEETHELDAIKAYLESEGFAVVGSSTSDEAMEQVETRSDLRAVVTDAHVPGRIDGVELAQMIRMRWPHLALVMTSGHSDAQSGRLPDGAVFINKPNLLEYLAPTLHRMIQAPS
jgi:DNA-binding NtrC family response regulator